MERRIRFCSVVREATNPQGSPYAGFPVPGAQPIAVRRKLLAAVVPGLRHANARISGDALQIESLDGKRKYSLKTQSADTVKMRQIRKEHHAFAGRQAAASCRQNGWVRKVTFAGDPEDPDGTIVAEDGGRLVTSYERAGLRIVGHVVYHAGSGKSVLIARNHQEAFVAAEKALKIYGAWEQDAESLLQSLGAERLALMRQLRMRVAA